LVIALGAGAIVAPFGSLAQQHAAKVAKIGWLETGLSDRNSSLGEIFRGRLREFGYHEGKNLIFEYRSAENKLDRLPALADELVRLNVDLIVASASPPTIAARNATKTIPIVFIQLAIDPVAAGIVNSFARPGGNITGLTNAAGALAGKRLELLKQFVPKLSRVAIMWEPRMQVRRKYGRTANPQHGNLACSYIPRRLTAPMTSRARSNLRFKRAAGQFSYRK
jgi:putative ABC transport system substrate-binding protein